MYAYYTATATIDSTGNIIGEITVEGAAADPDKSSTGGSVVSAEGGKYTVTAYLTSQDLSGVEGE